MSHVQAMDVKRRYPHLNLKPNIYYLIRVNSGVLVSNATKLIDRQHEDMFLDDDLQLEIFLDDFSQTFWIVS